MCAWLVLAYPASSGRLPHGEWHPWGTVLWQMRSILGVEFQGTFSLEGLGVETFRCSQIRIDHHKPGKKRPEARAQRRSRVLMG